MTRDVGAAASGQDSEQNGASVIRKTILSVEYKVFHLHDIEQVCQVLETEHQRSTREGHRCLLDVSASDEYGVEYASESTGLLTTGGQGSGGHLTQIEITFADYTDDKRIRVRLSEEPYATSSVSVQAKDVDWFYSAEGRLKAILARCEKQPSWMQRYRELITIAGGIGFARAAWVLIDLLWGYVLAWGWDPFSASKAWFLHNHDALVPVGQIISWVAWLAYLPMGWLLADRLTDALVKLWPSVELQIGPPHTCRVARRRAALRNVVLLWVVPVLAAFLYDLIKAGFGAASGAK